MVEGTTLRCGRHAKPVVWEAESCARPHLLQAAWMGNGTSAKVVDAETALANWDALDRELPMTSRHVVCLLF
ncbi:BQ5605_C139g13422 [Microbotryum silenes-dioicae]|uniref:BQ5605_C139g13422 protein n=2 Tax=Microbotryum silenes-dioicae TaxID=796604 RepID=A0A2X0P9L7_9BASI|nr:BQ5605_C139g13422 [Microbotryum silenes-dioicae]